jgi:hypothetical protein
LIVSDQARHVEVLRTALARLELDTFVESVFVRRASHARLVVASTGIDIVLAGAQLPDGRGDDLLEEFGGYRGLLDEGDTAGATHPVWQVGEDVGAVRRRLEAIVELQRLTRVR